MRNIMMHVKPVFTGHIWDKKWPFRTGDLLIEV